MDVSQCRWIDGLRWRVLLRGKALGEVKSSLQNESKMSDLSRPHSLMLRNCLLDMITRTEEGNTNVELEERFVHEDNGEELPIRVFSSITPPVFSSITPRSPIPFLLHVMLMCGKFETELDLRMHGSMHESLAVAKLIGNDFENPEELKRYSNDLIVLVITDVLSVQPVSLRRLDEFIVQSMRIFDAILVRNEIPINELPPCILTELLNEKNKELEEFWDAKKNDQLTSIYQTLQREDDSIPDNVPDQDTVFATDRWNRVQWDPVESLDRFEGQTDESFDEQKLAVSIATRSMQKYCQEFG